MSQTAPILNGQTMDALKDHIELLKYLLVTLNETHSQYGDFLTTIGLEEVQSQVVKGLRLGVMTLHKQNKLLERQR